MKNKILKYIFLAVATVMLLAVGYYHYNTHSIKLTVKEQNKNSMLMVYQKQKGEYIDTKQSIDELQIILLIKEHIFSFIKIMIRPEKKTVISGCIIYNKYVNRIKDLKQRYHVAKIPELTYVKCETPLKGFYSKEGMQQRCVEKLNAYVKIKGYTSAPVIIIEHGRTNKRTFMKAISTAAAVFPKL